MSCRVVVLVSGDGSLLQSLLDATARPGHPAEVVAVVSDRPAVRALERAVLAGVPTDVVRPRDHLDRTAWDTALTQATAEHRPDLVVLAGFNRLVGAGFLARFGGRVLNSHPALLPAFPGLHAVRDAIAHGVKVTGATLFVVDAGTDTGPIVAQVAVPVAEDDTELTLHERIKQAERVMLPEQVGRLAGRGFTIEGRKVVVAMTAHQAAPDQTAPDRTAPDRTAPDRAAPDRAAHEGQTGERRPVRRALLSVYDKAGLEELALGLAAAGVTLVSTGSTAARIAAAGVPVTRVEELTGFPESLDGRVKTLHPRVHAGLLADTRRPDHLRQLDELGIEGFDLLVGNLYPFAATVASGAGVEECIEQIDIGGPAMVRSAAKNHASVAVVVDPARYAEVIAAVGDGGTTLAQRQGLAAAAFQHTATYDAAVAGWMAGQFLDDGSGFPGWLAVTATQATGLRYGENPHQPAALYARADTPAGIAQADQLHGKEMSYNNYVDADAALRAAWDFAEPCVAIIKHTNPCGLAVAAPGAADPVADAHARALACDPVSAFGGVVAVNRTVTAAAAEQIAQVFTEVVVAPDFEPAAVDALSRRRSIRLLRLPPGFALAREDLRTVSGGLLVQVADRLGAPGDDPGSWTLAAGSVPDAATMADLLFAWRACRSVHSNAVLLADDGATVGIGMGQVNRVDSARLAVARAGDRAAGSVAAGDAYFPFADGLQVLLDAGVRAVVQPGGSKRDPEVVAAAEAAGVSMYLTGVRHFRH